MPPVKKKEHDPLVVSATPTKEFFIYMLTRDLILRDAISDLVDNSVDAVRALVEKELPSRPVKDLISKRYKGFEINLTFNKEEFIIEDNCGGLEAEKARKYAFRFGRDKGAPPTPGSIGQFGIGMKRALFKLGMHFTVTSVAANSSFTLDVPVDKWAKDKNDWDFKFSKLNETIRHDIKDRRLVIKSTKLHPDVAALFHSAATNTFEKNLIRDISREHLFTISNGLTIKVNGFTLPPADLTLLDSNDFKVGTLRRSVQETDENKNTEEVRIRIFSGIGPKVFKDGGWYIFCNDRLVTGPDQSHVTGWTGSGADGIPIYHDQYARFRGYVFIDSDNAGLLPWNTTKTSMDMDSKLYQSIRREMINMARPVITFLNALKRENETGASQQRPLHMAINSAAPVAVLSIPVTQQAKQFSAPKPKPKEIKKAPTEYQIKYSVPMDDFTRAQEQLGVNKDEVGPATFQYYFRNEVE